MVMAEDREEFLKGIGYNPQGAIDAAMSGASPVSYGSIQKGLENISGEDKTIGQRVAGALQTGAGAALAGPEAALRGIGAIGSGLYQGAKSVGEGLGWVSPEAPSVREQTGQNAVTAIGDQGRKSAEQSKVEAEKGTTPGTGAGSASPAAAAYDKHVS